MRNLEATEQMQHAFQIFFGVGTLHTYKHTTNDCDGISTNSLEFKSEVCTVWYILICEDRLLRKAGGVTGMQQCGRASWMRSMSRHVGEFGWPNVSDGLFREVGRGR